MIKLDISYNKLNNSIFVFSSNLYSTWLALQILSIGKNLFYGPLHLDFTKLCPLSTLTTNNKITRPITPTFGAHNSSQLVLIDHSYNQLVGNIPSRLAPANSIRVLKCYSYLEH